jgi:hypothetical protein
MRWLGVIFHIKMGPATVADKKRVVEEAPAQLKIFWASAWLISDFFPN